MELLRLLAAVLLVSVDRTALGISHPKPSCHYPPSQWCRSLEIAIECKVSKTDDRFTGVLILFWEEDLVKI